MKRTLSLLLALLLCLSLAACSSTDTTPGDTTDVSGAITDPIDPTDPGETDETPAAVGSLPLTTEPVTFTGWVSADFVVSTEEGTELDQSPAYAWIAEQTGITLDVTVASTTTGNEQFNLMLVSQSYPDYIYYNLSNYVGGMAKYIEDGIVVDVAPYLATYAPNYSALRDSDESVRRATTLDNGQVGGFFRVLTETQKSWMGPMLRADWMDELGLSSPKTLDEWTAVLTAFRDRADCTIPYVFATNGDDNTLRTTYGLPDDKFFPVDGQIQYRYVTEGFRDYLAQASA